MNVHRFSLQLFGGSYPICYCSTATSTGGLQGLCWGLSRGLACGVTGFTVGWLMTELEATGELFMLMGDQEIKQ